MVQATGFSARSTPGKGLSTQESVGLQSVPDERPQPSGAILSKTSPAGRSATFSFLFADDIVHRRNQIERLLAGQPLRIVWASTADEAIAALKKRRYDIISLDHDMGGPGSGFVPDEPGDPAAIIKRYGGKVARKIESAHHLDGLDVAQALVSTPNVDSYIFIHSMNPVGAAHMKNILPQATWLPFQHMWLEVNMIKRFIRDRQA